MDFRFLICITFAIAILALAACSPAQATPVTQPAEVVDLTSDPGGLLTPDAILTLTATEPATSPPPSPTPTVTPKPTEEPSSTPVTYSACDALSRQQAETIIGSLDGDPFVLEYIGPGPELVGLCVFPGALNTASIEVYQFNEAAKARAQYDGRAGGEVIVGVGDAANWSEGGLVLGIVRGTATLYIMMSSPDGARDQAIQVGQIAVGRIP